MKLRVLKGELKEHPRTFIRRCGYGEIFDSKTKKMSYVRRISSYHYPRYHMYITDAEHEVIFDLHVDETASVREGARAHNAQYEGALVENELTRIYSFVKTFDEEKKESERKESFFKRLFKRSKQK